MLKTLLLTLLCGLICSTDLPAQKKDGKTPAPAAPATTAPAPTAGPSTTAATVVAADSIMVTIILKHQQDKNLPEIRRVLEAQGFWDMFPPAEARVVTWTIAAGLGHIVTLMMPSGAVRRLNLALENGAWGAFNTEVYLSYDYKGVWKEYMEKREDAKADRN